MPGPTSTTTPPPSPPAIGHEAELALAGELLRAEAAAITGLIGRLDARFHDAVGLICRCADQGGTVLVAGLGKSGLIGQKISATLASLGITSHFVHPAEAAHGDLGRFRPVDLCIALSYSGETEEVVALAAILRQDGLPIIAITRGGPGPSRVSSLDRLATVPLTIGDCEDTLSPAPTCSTTASLALGDALAVCAARRRRFSDDDFAKRHPGGALGELVKPITDVLRFVVPHSLRPVPDDVPLRDALRQSEVAAPGGVRRPGAMVLVDRATGRLTGLFTDGDLRRLVERDAGGGPTIEDALKRPVSAVMTRDPGTLPATARVRDAVAMVREFRRDEIPVVDADHRPVGVLDVQDLIALRLIKSG